MGYYIQDKSKNYPFAYEPNKISNDKFWIKPIHLNLKAKEPLDPFFNKYAYEKDSSVLQVIYKYYGDESLGLSRRQEYRKSISQDDLQEGFNLFFGYKRKILKIEVEMYKIEVEFESNHFVEYISTLEEKIKLLENKIEEYEDRLEHIKDIVNGETTYYTNYTKWS